nr:immunoglobulin light chain junction region [Macaca mulatta]MOW09876.1 immunoglobulin light chain junction region [Macaca mulatta]MOW13294.1 immunoglobulin light chain junction region [Macaca mulatta]MOW14463.1 immunoglobulin light chain junction region [Macaca mulatta]
CQQDYSFLFSF